ncbi:MULTISPECIES: DUF883 family protein [Sphingobium]|uniref:DUF883 domain-containing protein n=2 Tax=Sphingobium cupriresistens TaxID=1132417 RepID=A0A0J7Y3G2_9SPHN|nr:MULTISPECIES: DUF883 family protein [Sphingobium]KMS58456.1 hypothetical protein V473_10185 [Sphingobium cupriresistens LL01]MBJ7377710.1 DUF883 family protein [Sphingobium sp.]RYM11762.1 DUF883 family protein [Sphingobium cupriresistens]WCP11914.1 hypothetical protein sphantq_00309 [Sphingobium sp. AntQ-1]
MADIRAQLTRVREAANDAATTATDRIKDTGEKARESAGELIQTSRDKASEAYGEARDKTQRVATRANEIVQEHPIVAVAGAVAVGAVVAWMFPKSRAAMKALPGLAMTAGSRFLEAAAVARAAAAEGAETVKQGATHALHAAGDVAADARDSVASADLSAKASRLADEVTTLVAAKVDALSDAIKARLPKS